MLPEAMRRVVPVGAAGVGKAQQAARPADPARHADRLGLPVRTENR